MLHDQISIHVRFLREPFCDFLDFEEFYLHFDLRPEASAGLFVWRLLLTPHEGLELLFELNIVHVLVILRLIGVGDWLESSWGAIW